MGQCDLHELNTPPPSEITDSGAEVTWSAAVGACVCVVRACTTFIGHRDLDQIEMAAHVRPVPCDDGCGEKKSPKLNEELAVSSRPPAV
ncbi:hypothetical protein BaRGS_00000023 [Batillaria attramentaria]|uniref:Uncharacterized protein n=1 Tax=Batillaria attramentaria TaxID=370345 RepID=A0ABD0M9M4_9CAEN